MLVILIFSMALHYMMVQVSTLQHVALDYHYFMIGVIEVIMMEKSICKYRDCKFWKHGQIVGYLE